MNVIIKVEGMMCPHCERHVREAVMAVPGVSEAIPSHKECSVTVTYKEGADIDEVKGAISAAGYTVVD